MVVCSHIRIHHDCEGGIEKCVSRITDWQHEACRVMKNSNCEVWIFLSHPYTNNVFFLMLTTFYIGKIRKRLPENPDYAEMDMET